MKVVVSPPGYWLGKELSRLLGLDFVDVLEKSFPDGELYVRIAQPDKVANADVIVVSTFYPDQDRAFLKTLLLIDAVKSSGANKVIALVPYLAYSRQDRVFIPGEPVSSCVIVESLRAVGAEMLVTVDVHSPRTLECFKGPSTNITVQDVLIRHAIRDLDNPVLIAPDRGALERVTSIAKTYGLECDHLVKQRDRVTGQITYSPKELNVSGREAVIVDDIISTGSTIAESARILLKGGAKRVIVVATHGLLVDNALERITSAGVQKVLLADTLAVRHLHPTVEYINTSLALASKLRELLNW